MTATTRSSPSRLSPVSGSVKAPGNVTRSIHAFSAAGTAKLYIGTPSNSVSAARSSSMRGRVSAHSRSSAGLSTRADTFSGATGPDRWTRRPRVAWPAVSGGTGSAHRSRWRCPPVPCAARQAVANSAVSRRDTESASMSALESMCSRFMVVTSVRRDTSQG